MNPIALSFYSALSDCMYGKATTGKAGPADFESLRSAELGAFRP
jgi:hypothetical protein